MAYKAVVITVSDRCSRGEATDTSGPAIVEMVTAEGYEVIHTEIVPDEKERIREVLIRCADEMKADLIFTTGGTGFSKRDVTPDVTKEVVERETPGIPEAMLFESLKVTPYDGHQDTDGLEDVFHPCITCQGSLGQDTCLV